MSRNRKIIILGGAIIIIVLVVLTGSRFFSNGQPANDGKEVEIGGPSNVVVEGTHKLNAVLPPPQFFATKQNISDYVQQKVSPRARSASIRATHLNQDGSIDLDIAVSGYGSFSAKVYQSSDLLFFRVPASRYETSQSLSDIENIYNRGE